MADKIIKSVKFLPEFLQTGKNSKFLASTIDQLIQKPQLERLDGYIGSTRTPNYKSSDVYITESSSLRSNYQLDPSLIVKNVDGEVKDVLGLNDLINEIAIRGGSVDDFDRLFRTHYYSYDPHIDADKFVNYQNYYWLVNGPSVIDVSPDLNSIPFNVINVPFDILGQTSYTMPNNLIPLANGMKIRFASGGVLPTTYENKVYYVEGVGTSIRLVEETTLTVSEKIASIFDDSFDDTDFDSYPFDSYTRLPLTPDYITINRSSSDLNPWSRYNRWVHKDVIQISANLNGLDPVFPRDLRAQRPIIEFKPDIALYNFGTQGIGPVDIIDAVTTDAFSTIEGSAGHYADEILLEQGQKVIFLADSDVDVRGKVYEINFVNIDDRLRLTLVETYSPIEGDSTFVNLGKNYGGKSLWFNGSQWIVGQQHDKLNQPPLFDLFDENGISFSNQEVYSSDFKGNQIFGYEVGTGSPDTVLGFPLKYRNSVGVGSYLFKNYLTSETITLSESLENSQIISTSISFIKVENSYLNAWKDSSEYPIPLITSQLNTSSYFYDLPLGLTNNPLNGSISNFTLSDFRDHISTSSEMRLISNINPMPYALMFIGKRDHNLIDAVTKAADQYNNFKLAFVKKITELSIEDDPVRAVDEALKVLNLSKNENSAYYLSDMVAYGDDYIEKKYIVNNLSVTSYPITNEFSLSKISLRSILVYLNGQLLIAGQDYDFVENDPYVLFKVSLNLGDKISIRDFSNTKGCYIPSTPTKLGLYPKYQPRIFIDDSYLTNTKVIEGHDGSILVAYNDYRDDVILELEKRIYNNIKAEYRSDLMDFHSVFPGAFRTSPYSEEEINKIIEQDFIKWTTNYGIDPTVNVAYDLDDSYTWNYTGSYVQELDLHVKGSWRAMLFYLYDTDRPDLNPWEMLGFTEKPTWWEEEYGTNYGTTNTKLWGDLEEGRIRQGSREGIDVFYARPGLSQVYPVDAAGVLEDPDEHVINILVANTRLPWKFGDWGAAETAWRRSSYWPFVVQKIMALTKPADYAALMYDPIRLIKNIAGQWIYGDNKEFLNLKNMPIQGLNDYPTSGYSMWVCEAGRQRSPNYNLELQQDLENLDINLFYKVGGFVDKSQLQISIDAFDPLSTAPGALLQPEDYTLILNVSNPIRETAISAIIVQKTDSSFLVKGLDTQNPYFTIYTPIRSSTTPSITVGGITETYLNWSPSSTGGNTGLSSQDTTSASAAVVGTYYTKGQIVKYNNKFYVVSVSHRSGAQFDPAYFQSIPSLPIKGGATVQSAAGFDKTETIKVSYGTTYSTLQEIYDLIIGYGEWLKDQGFIFDEYNTDLQATLDWNYSGREFLYWTTQNWSDQSVIALSPFSNSLKVKFTDSVVDNIFNSFYEYSILEASGQALPQRFINVVRDEGVCTIKTTSEYRGIYFARLYSVQKEHAIVFNNRTIFNDSIYEIETGYRQARMKLLGFRTANWNGDYFSPGFVYDTAIIANWQQFKDYKFEDVVRFNSQYYAAKENVNGSAEFNFDSWRLLGSKPVAALIPNFDYKISQFEDFYSLDTNNFDEGQQKAAQHLIGYTPRVYLNNIFPDPVSQYKFYQGFIREKGTRNSISKLQRATVQNLNGKIDYNEEWAFRVGYYGSYSSYREIEVPLLEGTFYENPQIIEFTDVDSTITNLKVFVHTDELSIKPHLYTTTQTFITTNENYEDVFVATNAGYVRFDDVNFNALNEAAILAFTNTDIIEEGQTIWLANDSKNDWTVLRKVLTISKLISVDVDPNTTDQYNFTTDRPHGFAAGQVITIEEFDDSVNGIYKITKIVDKDTFAVVNTETTIVSTLLTSSNPGLLFKFDEARYDSFDNLPQDSYLLSLPRNSKVWVDNDGNGEWKVYQKLKNYRSYSIPSSNAPANQDLGYYISKQKSTDIYMVGNPSFSQAGVDIGNVFVYNNLNSYSTLLFRYGINNVSTDTYYDRSMPTGFGTAVHYDTTDFIDTTGSTGYGLMFAGGPLASKVEIPAVPVVSGTLIEQGLVKISSINPSTMDEKPIKVIKSPQPSNYERYGSSIFVTSKNNMKILLVGAPKTSTLGTGTVYRYELTTSTVNTGTVDIVSTSSLVLNYSTISRIEILNSGTNYKVNDIITITSPIASSPLTVRISKVNAFGSVQTFAAPVDNSVIFNTVPGSIITSPSFTTNNTGTGLIIRLVCSNEIGSQWGHSITGSELDSFARNKGVIAVGAPGFASGKGFVAVYTNTTTQFSQYLLSPFENNSNFGNSIVVSPSGSYIFVAAPNARGSDQSYGKVAVYYRQSSTQTFTLTQIISNPVPGVGMKFGQSLDINIDEEELVVSAIGTNRRINVTFDDYTKPLITNPDFKYDNDPNSEFSVNDTSYDIDSTYFIDRVAFSGSVYVYNRKNNLYKIADELPPVNISSGTNYGYSITISDNNIFVGAPARFNENNTSTNSALYQFYKIDPNVSSWKLLRYQEPLVKVDAIQRVSLIDTEKDEVVNYLEVVDPLKGKILGIAEQELSYKLSYDPAVYSVGDSRGVVDLNTNWLDEHVGELWWDLSTVKYPWYEQGELEYRKNYWGVPFPGSQIDVYEWVKTPFLPSQWAALANTREGLAQGVSGQPKYPDNSNLSVRQIYNPISGALTNYYYYWVKNSLIAPNAKNRRISGYQVAELIANPKVQGQQFVEILAPTGLAIANSSNYLVDNKIHLNVVADEINNKIPKHTEWLVLQEGSATSMPPAFLEQKLLDSLTGTDKLGQLVPDPTLSARERYGISIRPRQTMFKDRTEALRNVVEFINSVLINERTTGVYRFDNLLAQEDPPPVESNEYDLVVEETVDLDTIDTDGLETAELGCTVYNGKIISVSVLNPGYGYKTAPTVEIENNLYGARITTEIDALGRVIATTIVSAGEKFVNEPILAVRPFSVLVLADSTYNGKWTRFAYNSAEVVMWRQDRGYLYGQKVKYNNNFYSAKYDIAINTAFDPANWVMLSLSEVEGSWVRVKTQLFNTTLYWNYVDWSSNDYNRYKEIITTVDEVYLLEQISVNAGDYVKVRNNGQGYFIILEKTLTGEEGTFNSNFNLMYQENGTIQISDNIWNTQTSNLGFDKNTYDQTLYNQTPDIELGYILDAIKNDIFVGPLKIHWNLLFFTCVRYALSEQKLLDWAFKTSFINVVNYAGELKQLPVYKLADAKFYEDYILEAKPYHTQIRSFTTNHSILDTSKAYTTDFDLPPVYDFETGKVITVNSGSEYLSQYPWKSWADNYGSTDTVRINQITLKYNRISKSVEVEDLDVEDNFIADGLRAEFTLSWLAQPDIDNISVFLENNKVLNSDYQIVYYRDAERYDINLNITNILPDTNGSNNSIRVYVPVQGLSAGDRVWIGDVFGTVAANGSWIISEVYTDSIVLKNSVYSGDYFGGGVLKAGFNSYLKNYSKLVFRTFIPSIGQRIKVVYKKNIELLSAVDRVLNFYSPTDEMPGKDLAQLMTGIEYGQTNLEGLSLNYSTRWGDVEVGYDNAPYEDELSFYTFTTSSSVSGTFAGTLTLIQVNDITGIEVGQTVNIISSTSSYFITTGTYDEPKVYSIDAFNNYVYVNKPVTSPLPLGTKFEFWTYNQNPSIIDTQYIGGDFSYVINTATGAIEIDGDGFITPDTSYAPEELIPGEVHESLGINVYTKAPIQSPIIVASSIDITTPYTTTTRVLTVVPPSPAAIIVSYNNSVMTATLVQTATALTSTLYLSRTDGFYENDELYQIPGLQTFTFIDSFTGTNGIVLSKPITSEISSGTIIQVIKGFRPTIFEYVPYSSTGTTFTAANQYSVDWTNDNGRHPVLIIPPQPKIGRLNYTVIDMGAASTVNQTGFVDSNSAVVEDTNSVELESLGIYGTVKSAYVTLNGIPVPPGNAEILPSGAIVDLGNTGTWYVLTYANELNKRAAAKVFNIPNGTNVVSAWFFGTEQKLWNEIREEIKTVPRFAKHFTAVATNASAVITDVSDTTGIVGGGVTKLYARDGQTGNIFWLNPVQSIVGTTITLGSVIQLPPGYPTSLTLEFGVVQETYTEITSTGTWNSSFAYPPGNVEPHLANAIVEFNNNYTGSRRMLIPPMINYYAVDNVDNNTFGITNKDQFGNKNNLNINEIRVYLNGSELRRGFDFVLNEATNVVKIDSSLLQVGDVIAIVSKPASFGGAGHQDYEYDIYNNNFLLCASQQAQQRNPYAPGFNIDNAGWNIDWEGEIKIITYNNHDSLLMRTEVFEGNPAGRFKISRPILDESYIWVSINGIPLANYVDFEVLDDQMTIQITDSIALTTRDTITVVSFASNKTTRDIVGFRLFNDLFNRYHYKRLSRQNSTVLTQPLTDMDSMVYVRDAGVFTQPIIDQNVPGAVLINGERIEFFKIYSSVASIEILSGGGGFTTNDTVTFNGANWIVPLVATVTANNIGGIISLTFTGGVYNGNSIAYPTSFTSTSGNGTTATFKLNLANNTVLAQLRRGTLGTSPKVYSQANTNVIDQGGLQTIPYADRILKQNVLTTASLNTYTISTSSFKYYYNTGTLSTSTWLNDGIVLSSWGTVDPVNQLEVYYGGRKLNKGYTFSQDTNYAYDNQQITTISGIIQLNYTATTAGLPPITVDIGTAYVITTTNQVWVYENSMADGSVAGYVYRGLTRKDPEFTLNTSTQVITLNIPGGVKEGIRLTVVKKEFPTSTLWNNNGVSLLDSNSNPAKFLRARPAELPDDQYYGGDFELTDNSGAAYTDDQGNPFIGIN